MKDFTFKEEFEAAKRHLDAKGKAWADAIMQFKAAEKEKEAAQKKFEIAYKKFHGVS
jgi:hypothetical protein